MQNLNKANSKKNTFVVGFVEIKDSFENLKVCMETFKSDLEELQGLVWDKKKIKLVFFGDYEFLSKLYGLSGAAGNFPCLWCVTSKSQMKKGPSCSKRRTLKMIQRSHFRFKTYGKGIKKNVNRYHNCLHQPLVSVPLEHVVPPYLHLLLGIVLRHHRLLEAAADHIDARLAAQSGDDAIGEGESARRFKSNWVEAEKLKAEAGFQYGRVTMADETLGEDERQQYASKLEEALEAIENLETGDELKKRQGPVCSKLDGILKCNNITPQAYHSRAFNGNHCHKYVTKGVYKELTDSIIKTTRNSTKNINVIEEAERVQRRFNMINEAFSSVHEHISHGRPVDKNDFPSIQFQIAISNYTAMYRKMFPGKVFPKLHILEHHCLEWIKRFGFGMATHGEQGMLNLLNILF